MIAPIGRLGKLPRIPFVQLGPLPYGNFDMTGGNRAIMTFFQDRGTSLFDKDRPLAEINAVNLVSFPALARSILDQRENSW